MAVELVDFCSETRLSRGFDESMTAINGLTEAARLNWGEGSDAGGGSLAFVSATNREPAQIDLITTARNPAMSPPELLAFILGASTIAA